MRSLLTISAQLPKSQRDALMHALLQADKEVRLFAGVEFDSNSGRPWEPQAAEALVRAMMESLYSNDNAHSISRVRPTHGTDFWLVVKSAEAAQSSEEWEMVFRRSFQLFKLMHVYPDKLTVEDILKVLQDPDGNGVAWMAQEPEPGSVPDDIFAS